MKKCFKCQKEKPLTEFYKHLQMSDGHVNKCKECYKNDVKGNYLVNIKKEGYIENERKRGRQKYHRLYKGTVKSGNRYDIIKRWKERFPEKLKCSNIAQQMKKPFDGAEKHHWSYNEEHAKDVIWLTKKEHMKGHRFIIYDQERMMYRRFDNNILLDTKEAHELFIKDCIKNKED